MIYIVDDLSKDIRERLVKSSKANEGSVRILAQRFSVGVASLQRLLTRERKTGSVEPKPHQGGAKPQKKSSLRSINNSQINSVHLP